MAASHAQSTRAPAIDASLAIGAVRLAVADLATSIDFYERALGLALISRDGEHAVLGPDRERPTLELQRLADPVPAPPDSTGLFHVAWLHPSREELAATVERVVRARWPIHGASDHGVSEALYLSDPDGLGVEIYADRPRERWQRAPDGEGIVMYTRPLDLDDLLAQAPLEQEPRMPGAITIGHVHLKVSDVPRALGFYRDVLGFEERAQMPSAAFVAAGGYHHHVGLNSWQSEGAGPAPPEAPGLRMVTFELGAGEALERLAGRLADQGVQMRREPQRLQLGDPDGNRMTFTARR